MQGTSSPERFECLDGARALLAWWVVFGHMLQQVGFLMEDLVWPISVVRQPGFAVDVFIILSGFVIAHLVTTNQEPYPAYIFRRFMRLFPVFFVVIVGFVLISVFVRLKALPWDSLPSHLLAHVFMLHGAVPNEILERASDSIVPPAWSISLEWQFYLVAPFVIAAIVQPRWWLVTGLALVAALSIWSGLHLGVDLTWRHEAFLPLRVELFVIGILSYRFLPLIPALTVPAVLLACLTVWLLTASYPLAVWTLLFGALRCPAIAVPLTHPTLIGLGALSYCTYLLHMPVLLAVRRGVLLPFVGAEHGGLALAVLAAVSVPAVVVLSYLLHRYVELPGIRFGREGAAMLSRPHAQPAE